MPISKTFTSGPAVPHLVNGPGGLAGEVFEVRKDTDIAFAAFEKATSVSKFFLRVSTSVLDVDGIKASFASVAAPVVLTVADFDGILAPGAGAAVIKSPKRVTLTVGAGGTPAHWLGGSVVVTGKNVSGVALVETVASTAGAGTTTTVNFFAEVTQVNLPEASGVGGLLELGVLADTGSIDSITSSLTAQLLDTNSEFNRERVGNRVMDVPRRISFVFSNHASWIASNIALEGIDVRGNRITELIAVPAGGNATVNSVRFYMQVTKIPVPAQGGVLGTCEVGILNTELGLDQDVLSSVVAVSVLREGTDPGTGVWVVPTAGTVLTAAGTAAAPYGRYAPNVAPDGVRSYVLVYLPNPA